MLVLSGMKKSEDEQLGFYFLGGKKKNSIKEM